MFYLSCPICKKKVIDENAGFKCENCNKVQQKAIPMYTFTARVSDLSGNCFLQFMGESGDAVMGMTSTEFKNLKEHAGVEEIKEILA